MAFANATSDYLVVMDETGTLRFANPAFVQNLMGGQEPAGQSLFSLLDKNSAERARRALAGLTNGQGDQQVELTHYERDGRPHPIHYSFCRIEDGIAGLGRDKTQDLELLGEIVQLNLQLEEKQTQLADANARLEQLAVTDHITGLYNRRHFFTVVQHLYAEARRYGLAMCCFMMDADHFKGLNDSYGHMFGDHVLKVLAERMRKNIRRSDVLARYGGEEFVMVAPNTDLATGIMLAERLRAAVEQEPFILGNTSTQVSISVGLACTEHVPEGPFEDLLQASDLALYAAKEAGRNRCHVWSPLGSVHAGPSPQ